MDREAELLDLAKRVEKFTKLFLALGVEPDQERVDVYVEATSKQPTRALLLAMREISETWCRDDGIPTPGDLNLRARKHRERDKALFAAAKRREAVTAGDTREERTARVVSLAEAVRRLRLPMAEGE